MQAIIRFFLAIMVLLAVNTILIFLFPGVGSLEISIIQHNTDWARQLHTRT
jgi:hypothetical protein